MPCLNPDGTLSPSGRRLLAAVPASEAPGGATAYELAAVAELPLFRVRSSLREAEEAGLVAAEADRHRRTPRGDRMLLETASIVVG